MRALASGPRAGNCRALRPSARPGHFIDRGKLEDLPEDVQTLFRVGLNRIGMG